MRTNKMLCGIEVAPVSILKSSKQQWKFVSFFLGMGVSCILMLFGELLGEELNIGQPVLLSIFGIFIGIFSFLFACISIKCSVCKDTWFWRAVSKNNSGDWLFWLVAQESCPKCGEKFENAT